MADKATVEEVLAAVNTGSVYTSKASATWAATISAQPMALTDVVRLVAEQHGLDRHTQFDKYDNPAVTYAKYVSTASVANAVRALVEDGAIVAVAGTHWSLHQFHNTRRNATYYFSRQAQALASARADELAEAGRDAQVGEYAARMLTQRHPDEFEEIKRARLEQIGPPDHASRW